MKKVAIVGLGWLGMPLGRALMALGWRVSGSKTTQDGVDTARMHGMDCYYLHLTPNVICNKNHLKALLNVEVIVITLPVTRMFSSSKKDKDYLCAIQNLVESARDLRVSRIIFTSSIAVYGEHSEIISENTPLSPNSTHGKVLREVENWLLHIKGVVVDILRLSGLVGPKRHPGYFLSGKTELKNGSHGVNLVHRDDVISVIILLLKESKKGGVYNLSALQHPARNEFYPHASMQVGLTPPTFTIDKIENHGKIIDGSKICREFGFIYRYSDPNQMLFS
ncbi:NAD-dependent epimerase/dehydratase family protein [Candidatus Erwinia haradaeae]|uniref:Protein YeeZ n=1 Tax=Candidatus Erwinia haradaeae TaxID=1922217 RepID=A0A451DAL7_9GAMM|nr:NAD-dependent epimerase/dehydratase family protein [Candidatus Erwinia haradaeae]VFP83372.1 Protein YeeZ [Candidatus Erwinia haradaeae]